MWIWRRGWGRALSEEGTGARGGRSTQSAEERRRQVGGKESCGDRLRLEKREKAEAQVPGDRGARKALAGRVSGRGLLAPQPGGAEKGGMTASV